MKSAHHLLVAVVTITVPSSLSLATCTLWQYVTFRDDPNVADCSSAPTTPFDVVPLLEDGAGHLQARHVPKCVDGTDLCPEDEWIRCVDGTRPVYYYDAPVEARHSRTWVFWTKGGTPCAEMAGETAAEMCLREYTSGPNPQNMTTMHADASVTGETKDDENIQGILSELRGDPEGFNVFADHNRIFIPKCTYDGYLGAGETVAALDDGSGGLVDVTFYHHGRRLLEAVLRDLVRDPLVDPIVDDNGAGRPKRLSDLARAQHIVFSGSSFAAIGVIHNVDWIASLLPASVELTALLDARFKGSLDAELHFDDITPGELYDPFFGGSSTADGDVDSALPDLELVRGEAPYTVGNRRTMLDSWAYGDAAAHIGDASCWDYHDADLIATGSAPDTVVGDGMTWRCYDHFHVLFNHVQSNAFIGYNLLDGGIASKPVQWATNHVDAAGEPAFAWSGYDQDADGTVDFIGWEDHTDRVVYQAAQFLDHRSALAEEALGNRVGIYLPYQHGHVNLSSNYLFGVHPDSPVMSRGAESATYMDAVAEFLAPGAADSLGWIDDLEVPTGPDDDPCSTVRVRTDPAGAFGGWESDGRLSVCSP